MINVAEILTPIYPCIELRKYVDGYLISYVCFYNWYIFVYFIIINNLITNKRGRKSQQKGAVYCLIVPWDIELEIICNRLL